MFRTQICIDTIIFRFTTILITATSLNQLNFFFGYDYYSMTMWSFNDSKPNMKMISTYTPKITFLFFIYFCADNILSVFYFCIQPNVLQLKKKISYLFIILFETLFHDWHRRWRPRFGRKENWIITMDLKVF